eukprot:CAMPEP_0197536518 /NCGR_PEP_ID=MMETSP1318-20131121/54078_1 /TAXON_ID=552666 /ORGANISM="Partenskyella glossopodia, Strain RCC365" /LENGTH=120 /DNA_ID=CAMNT_0043094429 /DNA_START=176 /DNA_END=538 /DNA_ORIENTATION=-
MTTGDEELSLSTLGDVASDGKFLGNTIRDTLNKEWIVQDIHTIIGNEVEKLYIQFRGDGINDVTLMVLEIGGVLSDKKKFDMEDAFVNGWDVANMVGDLLLARIQSGGSSFSDVVRIADE